MIRLICIQQITLQNISKTPGVNQDLEMNIVATLLQVHGRAFLTLEGVGLKPASVSATKTIAEAFNSQFVASNLKNKYVVTDNKCNHHTNKAFNPQATSFQ